MKAQEKKRSLDVSREQEQAEEVMWVYRMDDLSTGKERWETHVTPISDGKNTGAHKALFWKATVRERGKTPGNCWLEDGGGVHDKVEVGITMHHGHGVNLRREELQRAPNAEVADKDPGPFLKP